MQRNITIFVVAEVIMKKDVCINERDFRLKQFTFYSSLSHIKWRDIFRYFL